MYIISVENRAQMAVVLLLLSMCVIQMTSSQSTNDIIQQENDVNNWRTEHLLSQLVTLNTQMQTALLQLVSVNTQMQTAVLQMQTAVSQLQKDVAEIKAEMKATDQQTVKGMPHMLDGNTTAVNTIIQYSPIL